MIVIPSAIRVRCMPFFCFLLLSSCAQTCYGGEAVLPAQQQQSGAAPVPTLTDYAHESPGDLAGGVQRIFSKDNTPLALAGFGLAGLAFLADDPVKNYFQDKQPMGNSAHLGNAYLGQGYVHIAVGAAFIAAGELCESKHAADTGVATLEALLMNGIATQGTKYIASRRRPNGTNTMSFPSGHVSSTATLSATLSEMYDWDLRIAAPLYVMTAFVAASRIEANMHYLSDTIAGATLGTIIGASVARYHKEKRPEHQVLITPLLQRDFTGAMASWRF